MGEILRHVNADGSADIEYTEFIAATYRFQKNMQQSAVWNIFRTIDKDGSGKITKQEILLLLKDKNGQHASPANLSAAFPGLAMENLCGDLDNDGDGEIDIDEFTELLSHHCGSE